MLTLLLFLTALAGEPDPLPPPGPVPWSVEARIEEGWRRIARGDGEGARILAREALDRATDDVERSEAAYLLGVALQFDRRDAEAAEVFARVEGVRAADAAWRRALVLDDLDRPEEARRALAEATAGLRLRGAEAERVALVSAAIDARTGSPRALRVVARRLRAAPDDRNRWEQARAAAAEVEGRLARASTFGFDVPERRMKTQLRRRLDALGDAERRVNALAGFGEARFVIEALLAVGRAAEDLARDVRAAPVPARLPPDGAERYRALVARHADELLLRARTAYDLGLDVAGRARLDGPEVEGTRTALARVTSALDGVPP